MKKMDAKQQTIKFRLNPKFYNKQAILTTIDAYKELCDSNFDENNFEISLKPKEECSIKELSLEFCNYCLGMMK